MHGWISIPVSWQLLVLLLAPIIGIAAGSWGSRSKYGILLWIGYCIVYSFFAVLVAFFYEVARFPGHYDIAAWSILVVPVFIVALPAIGIPWVIARTRSRSKHDRDTAAGAAEQGVDLARPLAAAGVVVLTAVAWLALTTYQQRPSTHAAYVVPPIDPASAPSDLSAITNGSQWSCTVLRAGAPTHSAVDYHFSALDKGAHWQSFSHHDEQRPFFDLDHASGIEQFFAGEYSVVAGKLQLSSDSAGMPLGFDRRYSKADQDALRASHDPRLHGEILIQPNARNGVMEVIEFRSISATDMSLVIELIGDVSHTMELACARVNDPNFQPIVLLAPERLPAG